MRVLRIADVPNRRTGGMQRAMYGTGDVLRSRGHVVDYLFRDDLSVLGLERLRRFTVPVRIPLIVRDLARRGREYDAVEIHEPLGAVYCLLRKVGARLPPVIAFSHGLEERQYLLLLDYRRMKRLPISLKDQWSPLTIVRQAKYAARHADHVVCMNDQDLRHLRNAGIAEARVTKVPNGVSSEFLEAEPNWTRPPGSVLFFGTWIVRKGVADLVTAATAVISKESNARLTVAGCGVPRDRVLGEFPSDIRDRIDVIPKISSDRELIACYRRHSIFLLPSVFEGYPLAMLEAAALGLALVTTDVGGMAEFVQDGENGIKVPVGDPVGLAEAMLRLIRNEGESLRLGERARLKAREFAWERAGTLVLGAYEEAVRYGRGRSSGRSAGTQAARRRSI
jgi:glycosyltransferase involved in cell wall biosynthesis